MQRIITIISILVHSVSCFQKDFQSVSYDLVRYSNVQILKGIGQTENRQCRKIGSNFECPVSMTSLNNFKECLRKPGVSWSCPFDEYTREVQVAIRFNREYLVNSFLLSFKQAPNISALCVEIKQNGRRSIWLYYARSKMLCEFFFPSGIYGNKCQVKYDLYNGIISLLQAPIKSKAVVFHLYPPIVDSYNQNTALYSINQLYVGGSCTCSSGRKSRCIVTGENDYSGDKNELSKEMLLCHYDQGFYYHYRFYKKKRRRRRDLDGCTCNQRGTLYGLCQPFALLEYKCPCRYNFAGEYCNKCSKGYFGYPLCRRCSCNDMSSKSSICNARTGDCACEPKYSGSQCNKCAVGRYNFPYCFPCPCSKERTKESFCDQKTGACHCLGQYQGDKCTSCKSWLVNYPLCQKPSCKCSGYGSLSKACGSNDKCLCKQMYDGKNCDQCKQGFGNYPACTACTCHPIGSNSKVCDAKNGQCDCKPYFTGKHCDQCTTRANVFPYCNVNGKDCQCDERGTWQALNKPGSCLEKISCMCKPNVEGADCSSCKSNHYNLTSDNLNGCSNCDCSTLGTHGKIKACNIQTGQCFCKELVGGRTCAQCTDGYHSLNRWNLFGCTACNCNIGGSESSRCDNYGVCKCLNHVTGTKCDKIQHGNYFFPTFYHNKHEIETGYYSNTNKSIVMKYNPGAFQNFTGRGYVMLGESEKDLKLDIDVERSGRYKILFKYQLKEEETISMLVKFTSPDREISYPGTVLFTSTMISSYMVILTRERTQEFILTKGLWVMEMSTQNSNLLLDHVVLIPEDYYTAKSIQPPNTQPCETKYNNAKLCLMYKYIKLEKFYTIQAESGTNSKGYGNEVVSKTRIFEDEILLKRLPVIHSMAQLSKNQIALSLQVTVDTSDDYYIVITYFNPNERTQRLDLYDGSSGQRGNMEALPCYYRFMCRMVVLTSGGSLLKLKYDAKKTSEITILGNIRGILPIDYVTLIPVESWSIDYMKPYELCYMKNGFCQRNIEFQKTSDAVDATPNQANLANPLTKSVYAVSEQTVHFDATIMKDGSYMLIFQYYQPSLPGFYIQLSITLDTGHIITAKVKVGHCTAKVGCRGSHSFFARKSEIKISLGMDTDHEMWFDSVFLVPFESYTKDLLQAQRIEISSKFKRSCLNADQLPMTIPPEGFCTDTLFTLTTRYTGQVFECECNKRGSVSQKCNKIGGQCSCRKGVVGRQCDKCQTGYYAFPYCKPCNCVVTGSITPDCNKFGQCECKSKNSGKTCDRCAKGHWGFPNCQACGCDRRGSFTLTCRRYDGQCSCLTNYGGRQCNQCQVGYFGFPSCKNCNCDSAGIKITREAPTGCYSDNPNRCDCKENVEGGECDMCKDGYYGLSTTNTQGCSYCNCSTFGTFSGANICNKKTGQCGCRPFVTGRQCESCMEGYYHVKTDHTFTCQPCLCRPGGSLHNTCDKNTGRCTCKEYIGGVKCDTVNHNYHLPSHGDVIFTANEIVPQAKQQYLTDFDGYFVNGSFATVRLKFDIAKTQSYYIVIHYALADIKRPRIELEFFSKDGIKIVSHILRAKQLRSQHVDVVKKRHGYVKVQLPSGQNQLQVLFYQSIILNRITLVPVDQLKNTKIDIEVKTPCKVNNHPEMLCSMYTYYNFTKENTKKISIGDVINDNRNNKYRRVEYPLLNIKDAYFITYTTFTKTLVMTDDFYVMVHYKNFARTTTSLQFLVYSTKDFLKGVLHLHPCDYLFGCRQVVLSYGEEIKKRFSSGGGERTFTMQLTRGEATYIDYVLLIPVNQWSINHISPSFYCNQHSSKCLNATFPMTDTSFTLLTKKARGMEFLTINPPGLTPPVEAVAISNFQRNLRWLQPLKIGGFYITIHYYQAMVESFAAKIIVTTHQRALAGKVVFNYCASKYGCRAVVTYLEEELKQRFTISGNILRLTFTMPSRTQVWMDSITFVPTEEYHGGLLNIRPINERKKFIRKCIGRREKYIENKSKAFCQTFLYQYLLQNNNSVKQCKCNPIGSLHSKCNIYDGECECLNDYHGRTCSKCKRGKSCVKL